MSFLLLARDVDGHGVAVEDSAEAGRSRRPGSRRQRLAESPGNPDRRRPPRWCDLGVALLRLGGHEPSLPPRARRQHLAAPGTGARPSRNHPRSRRMGGLRSPGAASRRPPRCHHAGRARGGAATRPPRSWPSARASAPGSPSRRPAAPPNHGRGDGGGGRRCRSASRCWCCTGPTGASRPRWPACWARRAPLRKKAVGSVDPAAVGLSPR